MNSAPSKMKRAATETRDEIRNSAQCTALRAMTVSNPARMAAIENIQKKTDSQPERIILWPYLMLRIWCFVLGALYFDRQAMRLNLSMRTKYKVRRTKYYLSYFTVSRPCSSISRFQTN